MDDPEDGAGDAAQAFEALRAEVAVLRRAVEGLPAAWERPPDYSLDLGRMAKGLAELSGQVEAIGRHPALMLTPEQHRRAIAQEGKELMREAVQKLDRAAQEAERERHQLATLIGTARTQDRQFVALLWVGGLMLAIGLVLSPLIAGVLPFELNTRVAALVMRDDRWGAGAALMQAASPEGWQSLIAADSLMRANQDALAACGAAAGRAGHEQACTIRVGVPAR